MLKTTLQQIDKYKVKYMKQLKIMKVIKTSNLGMEKKMKDEKQKLKNMSLSYTIAMGSDIVTGAHVLDSALVESLRRVSFNGNSSAIVEQLNNWDDKDKAAMMVIIINT